jgi:mannose-6-phosphate isomerase-like protein (cupin superfamily)
MSKESERNAQNNEVAYDLEKTVKENRYFRLVLSTSRYQQLVAMHLTSGGIGREVHPSNDQFFKVEEGRIRITLDDKYRYDLGPGQSLTVDAGRYHQVETLDEFGNVGKSNAYANVYTIYSPPHHPPGTKQRTDPEAIH